MPTIHALQHLFSSVERGYFARQGRGFQTVAVAEELVETEDLQALERAAFYAVSRERRQAGDFPVKEAFFRLPSGRFAVGRIVSAGTDSLGREGNYLAHHLVLRADELAAAGGNPFSVLDAADPAAPDTDRTPRALPPLTLTLAPAGPDFRGFAGLPPGVPADLGSVAVNGGEKTTLLIGEAARTRRALGSLFAALAVEDRLRLTFCTHFYESDHLRPLFAFATVGSRAEAPPERQSYTLFDLDDAGDPAHVSPAGAYAEWLADCLQNARWEEIAALNATLDLLRAGAPGAACPPANARACAALWERVQTGVAPALAGKPDLMAEFLRRSPVPRPLANALLAAASPAELLGPRPAPDAAEDCLLALREKSAPKAWRTWVRRWEQEPVLCPFAPDAQPWWRRLKAEIRQRKSR